MNLSDQQLLELSRLGVGANYRTAEVAIFSLAEQYRRNPCMTLAQAIREDEPLRNALAAYNEMRMQ